MSDELDPQAVAERLAELRRMFVAETVEVCCLAHVNVVVASRALRCECQAWSLSLWCSRWSRGPERLDVGHKSGAATHDRFRHPERVLSRRLVIDTRRCCVGA